MLLQSIFGGAKADLSYAISNILGFFLVGCRLECSSEQFSELLYPALIDQTEAIADESKKKTKKFRNAPKKKHQRDEGLFSLLLLLDVVSERLNDLRSRFFFFMPARPIMRLHTGSYNVGSRSEFLSRKVAF